MVKPKSTANRHAPVRPRPRAGELLIRGALLVDPALGKPVFRNISVRDGRIADLTRRQTTAGQVLDAEGCWACPGFVDMHAHLREPGQTHKETIATGLAAAVRGGFTAVAAMPNTTPPGDSLETLAFVREAAARAALADLVPVCRITLAGRDRELAPLAALAAAGCRAVSNDGAPVEDADVMACALREAARHGLAVLDHCEDRHLAAGGVAHPHPRTEGWGLAPLCPTAEEVHVARDVLLSAASGLPVHICHLSTARGAGLVRWAKSLGAPVTAEACPHHFTLSVEDMPGPDPDWKMSPPLRSWSDREALVEALRDGTLDAIATDHAPHAVDEKALGFARAPFGIVGLETAVPLVLDRLHGTGILSPGRIVELLAVNPARILGLSPRSLGRGCEANVTLVAPEKPFTVEKERFASLSRNTPFQGMSLQGAVVDTLVRGKVVFHESR